MDRKPGSKSWAFVVALSAGIASCQGAQRESVPSRADSPLNPQSANANAPAASSVAPTGSNTEQSPQPAGLAPASTAPGGGSGDSASSTSAPDAGQAPCVERSTQSCGPEREEGICKFGTQTCTGGVWGECAGAIIARNRDCSSPDDNDCDGQPDNTVDDVCRCPALGTQACDEHPNLDGKGPCKAGQQACVLGAGNLNSDWGPCSGSVGPAAADSCATPGDDANCDSTPNSGCTCVEGQTVPCGPPAATGICQRGTSTCRNGAFTACQGAVFPAKRDCTSAQDNDCDGVPDNTIDGTCTCAVGTSQACGAHPNRDGNGPCTPGQQRCEAAAQNAASRFGACTGAVGPALRDSCTAQGDDADCSGSANTGCQCIAGQGNTPCSNDPNNSRCNSQGACAPCQANADCSLVSGGRNLCIGGRCAAAACGDGIVQPDIGEECDDGGTAPGDGCTPNCRVAHAPVGVTAYGGTHMCMIKPSAEIVCWGTNESGELGNGRMDPGTFGATAVSGISDATQLSLGPDNVCAVRRSGLVACWGLGFTSVPTNVAGLTGVTQVAVASNQACVISGARVSCAPRNSETPYGAFSDMGLDAVIQISAGNGQLCAVRSDGSLFCWGSNNAGQLGIGQPSNPSPTPILSLATGVAEVSAGGETTCVRLSNGVSQCFGSGPLGSRTAPTASPSPQAVVNLPNPLRFASLPDSRCALLSDQSVRCWGYAPLGDADGLPVAIALPGRAVEIGAGSEVACAVLEDLSVYCWGLAVSVLGLTPSAAGAQVPVRLTTP